jgi:anti-anti-sigma regulatory factor
MLFDLLQLAGRRADFELLAADYAERLASSPPSWLAPAAAPAPSRRLALAGTIDPAAVAALGALDGDAALLLDAGAVDSITPDGCQALLALLERLRRQQAPLAIEAIDALHGAIARTIAATPKAAPAWLLQLDLLQRCANPSAFEDAAMAYCAAFDMSPPSYVAPTPADTILGALPDDSRLHLAPALPADAAFGARLAQHAAEHGELIFDALALQRASYAAATVLQAQLRALHAGGLVIAFLDLNHLVAALFQLVGLEQVAKLHTRKH